MRIFVAGGTGAIGRYLVPMLVADGHDVTATTRRPDRAQWLATVGASTALLDAFDTDAVTLAVEAARPDVVIDQLTDLSSGFDPESIRRNARLRAMTTGPLVAAAEKSGATRFVCQGAAYVYADGPLPQTEDDPLRSPSGADDPVIPGIVALESAVLGARLEGVVLRYGYLYGPGTADAEAGEEPTVHVIAAARAALLAIDRGESRIYNVVDDGRLVSNDRAKRELGWDPLSRT
jgi:nucleoside-diphosphate-sugar epimerase